ncbi:hypothetical protein CJ739_3940 [Mariniflexile rhizosphaerae]|nr:hypothetical protein CJ739_3940 [Mariniflexile sp. TRM1-10]
MVVGNNLKKPKLTDKVEIESVEKLYNYLNSKLPISVDYKELYNLCFSLFCTLDILPEELRSLKITKGVLTHTFMKIAIIKNVAECTTESDWIDQIDNFLKFSESRKRSDITRNELNKNSCQ